MDDALLSVGEVADRFGMAVSTLHYWERRGLLRPAVRQSGRRYYGGSELYRIALIRTWQDTGLMSLDEIAELLAGRTATHDWRDTVSARVAAIDAQIERLVTARAYLDHVRTCPRDNPAADCPRLRAEVVVPARRTGRA